MNAEPPRQRVLFVTWDGPGVTYLEGLFLPIFAGLRQHGIRTDVLQFRWGPADLTWQVSERAHAAGCGYRAVRVLRRGGGAGAFASAVWGARAVRAAAGYFRSDVVMPRSMMPALATLTARLPSAIPVIFDADGLAADERVEFAGDSPTGPVYRLLRDIEAQAVRRSAAVITRSVAAAEILRARAGPPVAADRFHVVTNGRDDRVFTPGDADARSRMRSELGVDPAAPLVAYAGSIGSQYRFDLLARFMDALLAERSDARLLLLSRDPSAARAELGRWSGPLAEQAIVRSADPLDVPRFLACADLGVAFRARSFSTVAVAPVKLSEYLLCGLPVLGTRGIGDTDGAIRSGVLVDPEADPAIGVRWFVDRVLSNRDALRHDARMVGVGEFSLRRSVEDYRKVLDHV